MRFLRCSVCVPIKPPEPYLAAAISALDLSYVDEILFDSEWPLWQARWRLAGRARSDLVLNLDADTILPCRYLQKAIAASNETPSFGAMALKYAPPHDHGHYAFGTSLIPRAVMLAHYDWPGGSPCECRYMWKKLEALGYNVITLKDMVAEHRK